MAIRTFVSDRGDMGRRLDVVLRRHLADLDSASRTQLQSWIEAGAVSIDGRRVRRAAARVGPLATVLVDIPDGAIPPARRIEPEQTPLAVLFEDDSLLAVNKPPGMVVHPTHAHARGTLLNALAWHARDWDAPRRPSIVGRLDRLTSGIVVVAKTAAMHAALQRRLTGTVATKDYLAVVYGKVTRQTGRIDVPLGRDPLDRRRVTSSSVNGSASVTYVERLSQTEAPKVGLTLLRCRLATGRTHQIRAHLLASGWPIVGDPVYGAPRWLSIADPALADVLRTFPRQALHAWRVGFTHPATAAPIEIGAPLPSDMRGLLRALELTEPTEGTENPSPQR